MERALKSNYQELIQQEDILRLLFYAADHFEDDVKEVTENRPSILSGGNDLFKTGLDDERTYSKDELIRSVITPTNKTDDLDGQKICRLNVVLGDYTLLEGARFHANLDLHLYFYVHNEYDIVDFRLAKLVDAVRKFMFERDTGSLGRKILKGGREIEDTPNGYSGYRLTLKAGKFASA